MRHASSVRLVGRGRRSARKGERPPRGKGPGGVRRCPCLGFVGAPYSPFYSLWSGAITSKRSKIQKWAHSTASAHKSTSATGTSAVAVGNRRRRLFPEPRRVEWRLPFLVLRSNKNSSDHPEDEPSIRWSLSPKTKRVMMSLGPETLVHLAREDGHLADTLFAQFAGNSRVFKSRARLWNQSRAVTNREGGAVK